MRARLGSEALTVTLLLGVARSEPWLPANDGLETQPANAAAIRSRLLAVYIVDE
jgi:hypothetical protein